MCRNTSGGPQCNAIVILKGTGGEGPVTSPDVAHVLPRP
ncbi:hypothetical protein CLV41_101624 [Roseibium marinum]|uniref:Uncharacterized protein n=1 Tax=Roseibium marinum TaxID=281252 RepID=A0A2S3V2G7_9HYPH|nr:hypothetical protein CLV41_101624 [Roseibium marinum]